MDELESRIDEAAASGEKVELPALSQLMSESDQCKTYRSSKDRRVRACQASAGAYIDLLSALADALHILTGALSKEDKDAYLSLAQEVALNKLADAQSAEAVCFG